MTLVFAATIAPVEQGGVLQIGANVASAATLPVSHAGVDYYNPTSYFTGCADWTWLQAGCYTNSSKTSYHLSPKQLLASDLAFMSRSHLGLFQRVWISLDQLMVWNSSTGYAGYSSQALANVDDMLHQFAHYGIKTYLTLLTFGGGKQNEMRPMVIDGLHTTMRANYLKAIHDFVAHLAADPIDSSAVAVMDLQNEAYYQFEVYYGTGTTNASHLGAWKYTMPSWPASDQCGVVGKSTCTGGGAGKGCVSPSSGYVNTPCVDVNMIYPWLRDMYNTAKAAGPAFKFTVSDTGRLLTTDATAQQHWIGLYPVDVYDVHVYHDTPWTQTSRWASGLKLPKPWFSGESGCATGNSSCTYNKTSVSAVDKWWLANLKAYGASSVLIEDHTTAWKYVYDPNSATTVMTLTPTGLLIPPATG